MSFREFYDSQVPKYAILSHRWIGEEASFEEFYNVKEQDYFGDKFAKIRRCCAFARKWGWNWVWIDTCCIDKKSSAELSEAINSMFNWYRNAAVCYVYLADVRWDASNLADSRKGFWKSVWFKRGWTLQELLAPSILCFVDCQWGLIRTMGKAPAKDPGSETEHLIRDISVATGISKTDLVHAKDPSRLGEIAVARKMSWLSNRETSRVEDMAYCMLGLCGVNMPLLYGEGYKAFMRLQSEIIRTSDDESIFAWFDASLRRPSGFLATSPQAFARSGQVVKHLSKIGKLPFSLTNKGLHYRAPRLPGQFFRPVTVEQSMRLFAPDYNLLLDCGLEMSDRSTDDSKSIAINLVVWPDEGFSEVDVEKSFCEAMPNGITQFALLMNIKTCICSKRTLSLTCFE
ncbi:MAG: hypothetical protein Q9195_005206 [Heterodermia aff. obscurata]